MSEIKACKDCKWCHEISSGRSLWDWWGNLILQYCYHTSSWNFSPRPDKQAYTLGGYFKCEDWRNPIQKGKLLGLGPRDRNKMNEVACGSFARYFEPKAEAPIAP